MLVLGIERAHARADGVLDSFDEVVLEYVLFVYSIATEGLRPEYLGVFDLIVILWRSEPDDFSIGFGDHVGKNIGFQEIAQYLTVRCKDSLFRAVTQRLGT